MFNWLRKLFGQDIPATILMDAPDSPVVDTPTEVKEEPKKAKKKTATKKSKVVDLDSMNKTQLLTEAKKRGVKANASLKKDEILERIKNG